MLAEYNAFSALCCIDFCQQGKSGFKSIIITSLVHLFKSRALLLSNLVQTKSVLTFSLAPAELSKYRTRTSSTFC